MSVSKNNFSILKNHLSPFILNQIQYAKAYLKFLPHKKFVKNNYELKNIHKGKRCFLLGSGRSIDHEDLSVLKDEIIIAINSFSQHPHFKEMCNSEVRKYFFSAPIHAPYSKDHWIKHLKELERVIPNNVTNIFGLDNYNPNQMTICNDNNIFLNHKTYWLFSNVVNNLGLYKTSENDLDLQSNIWTSNTGSIGALITALYMGFDEIYLLGMDHDYFLHNTGEGRFYGINKESLLFKEEIKVIEEQQKTGNADARLSSAFNDLSHIFTQYERLNIMHPNKIYNLGKNSLLDVFPSKKLVEVIKKF
jgi:hypothetical protein|tara:strand:- start:1161 stop:2075 length:915 start_codon:yes stop_codon:yes gene_type:complete